MKNERIAIEIFLDSKRSEKNILAIQEAEAYMLGKGFRFEISPSRDQTKRGVARCWLTIEPDHERLGRNAGRKERPCDKTLADIRELEKHGRSAKEIAEMLNMSRQTYYRRRRRAIHIERTTIKTAGEIKI